MSITLATTEPMTDGDKAAAVCAVECTDHVQSRTETFFNLVTREGHHYNMLPLRLCQKHTVAHFTGRDVWESLTPESQKALSGFCDKHGYHLHVS